MQKRTLIKSDLVDIICEKTHKNRQAVKNLVESLLRISKEAIKKDGSLLISGLGKFEAYQKKARKGRNPQTEKAMTLPPRKVIVFRLSRKFRDEVNSLDEK